MILLTGCLTGNGSDDGLYQSLSWEGRESQAALTR